MSEMPSMVLYGAELASWKKLANMGHLTDQVVTVAVDGDPDFEAEPVALSVAELQSDGKVARTVYLAGHPADTQVVRHSAELYLQGHAALVLPFKDHFYTYPPEYRDMTRVIRANKADPQSLPTGPDGFMAGHFVYPDQRDERSVAGALFVPRPPGQTATEGVLWTPNDPGFHEGLEKDPELLVADSFPAQSLALVCSLVGRGKLEALLIGEGYIEPPFWYRK